MADETEADGGHRWPNEAAGDSMQQLRDHHRAEARPCREHKCARTDARNRCSREEPLARNRVHNRAHRDLQDEGCHGSDRKDEPNVELEPTDRCQIGGHKGTPAGLNVGHEKGEPVQTTQAFARHSLRHRRAGGLRLSGAA